MASVRIFTYAEIVTAPVAPSSGRFSSDSVGLLKQPYLGRDQVTINTGAAVATSAVAAPSGTRLVQVVVDPGKIVHYEVFPKDHSRSITEATAASPFFSGVQLLMFGPEWTISFLESVL